MAYAVFANPEGTVQVNEPVLGALSVIAEPMARLPELLPYRSCRVTVDAVVGAHLMVTCIPACRVPPIGEVIARGLFCAPVNVASSEAAVARIRKKRMLWGILKWWLTSTAEEQMFGM